MSCNICVNVLWKQRGLLKCKLEKRCSSAQDGIDGSPQDVSYGPKCHFLSILCFPYAHLVCKDSPDPMQTCVILFSLILYEACDKIISCQNIICG